MPTNDSVAPITSTTRTTDPAPAIFFWRKIMRRKNWRAVIVGIVLCLSALGFFLYMLSIASTSNDPAALMQTVGTVSGAVGGLSLAMIVFGLIGKKA
jgi:hypothetical protein